MYAQEAANGAITNLDYLQSFNAFSIRLDTKIMKTMLQYYDKPTQIAISGSVGNKVATYDPKKIKNVEFDLIASKAPNTASYRSLIEDKLFEMLKSNMIDIKMYLNNSQMPFAKTLLDQVSKMENQMQNGQSPQVTPDMINQVGANPQAVELINRATGRNN